MGIVGKARNEYDIEIVRLLVALLPVNVDEVPEFHQDFAEATIFVLVTIFDQQIEVRGC